MNEKLWSILQSWLLSDNEPKRRYAQRRLSLPDAVGYQPGQSEQQPAASQYPPRWQQAGAATAAIGPELRGWRNCLYAGEFTAGCCSAPASLACAWKRRQVSYADCAACIAEMVKTSC